MVDLVLQFVNRIQLLVVESLKLGEVRAELLMHAASRFSFDAHATKLPQPRSKCKSPRSHKAGFIVWPQARRTTPVGNTRYAS
ncbi:MAG: hypothetical protein DWQ34_20945 [Planctomycetota bacterium]|nr:MAG: hypothetical protein DWQ34_20945 [Planctomycetota bacterium]REK21622.1 MAG: hypothetical protein DWQ41_20765 [Planctomycetota bacterium]REK29985.1 MAG: hypothetical protein DWQ45_22170 [Planctomycetota bacterium]